MIDEQIEQIINFLDAICPMSEPLKEALRKNLRYQRFNKGQMLLKDGQTCTNIYFIVSGLLKIYIMNEKDKESIVWFMMKNDVMIAVDSFYNQQPGEEYIETLRETEVLYISHECLYQLYKEFPEFNIHRAVLSEKYYRQSHKREIVLKRYSREGRYRHMVENYPELVREVPNGLLASYLGMDPSYLSDIKKKVFRPPKQ